MDPVFEFPSEAERQEGAEKGTRFSKDDKKWAAQMNKAYRTLSRMNDNLTLDNFKPYLQDRSVDNIKSDIKTFESEAQALTQATQESFKKDKEWKRTTEMVVTGSSAMTGVILAIGIVPDDMHDGIRGEEPIKRKIFPLLDRDYQLRVDIETKNLIIRKWQLEILKSTIASTPTTATGVPIELNVARLLSDLVSVAVAKGRLQSKLRTIQQRRCLVEAELNAHREAHQCDESRIDDMNMKEKLDKTHKDMKAGKAVPRASPEDVMELIKCTTMQTRDEMTGKVAWGKDHDGRTIAQIAKEEGKSFGEILDEVGQEKEHDEKEKGKEHKGREKNWTRARRSSTAKVNWCQDSSLMVWA